MSEGNENEYVKQLTGSAGANMIFVVGFLLYRALQNRCTSIAAGDLEIEDDSSSSDIEQGNSKKHENVRSSVPEVQQGHDRELPKGDTTTPEFDVRKILEPENWQLADQTRVEKGFREIASLQKAFAKRLRTKSI